MKKSQQLLLNEYEGERHEFMCDVAKGCHHGSDDVSFEFLQAMRASATVISSGDNEGHAHPRPNIVSASAITGHVQIQNDELLTRSPSGLPDRLTIWSIHTRPFGNGVSVSDRRCL